MIDNYIVDANEITHRVNKILYETNYINEKCKESIDDISINIDKVIRKLYVKGLNNVRY